jgi:hypothetical protein
VQKPLRLFLSHATPDDEFVDRLDHKLRARGFVTVNDARDFGVGGDVVAAIYEDGIAKADGVVLILSGNTLGRSEGHAETWVFCDTQGGPLRKRNLIRRSFEPVLTRANLPKIRFHDLRHMMATLLMSQGVNVKVVLERLGHSSVALTLDTYSHVLPTMQRDAATRIDTLLALDEGT